MEGAGEERRRIDLPVAGAEHGAHRLLQDQRHAPGGQQRLQRPRVEIADDGALQHDAGGPGDQEGDRQRQHHRPIRHRSRHEHLHDVSGVGAEHHHLAMRHVDDAHHAEGDGQADGGEQQHGSGGNPIPAVLRQPPQQQRAVDGGDRRFRGAGDRGIFVFDRNGVDVVLRRLVAARGERGDGALRVGGAGVRRRGDDRRARLLQRRLGAGVGLLGELGVDDGERLRIGIVEEIAARRGCASADRRRRRSTRQWRLRARCARRC